MRAIKQIIIHHSASPQSMPLDNAVALFDRVHKQRLHPTSNWYWLHIAYHYVVSANGDYKKTRPIKEIGYHAGVRKVNIESVWICLVWNFEIETPTTAQYNTVKKLIRELQSLWDIEVLWHKNVKATACPGKNFDFRKLEEELYTQEEKKVAIQDIIKSNSELWDKVEKTKKYITGKDTMDLIDNVQHSLSELNKYLRTRWF